MKNIKAVLATMLSLFALQKKEQGKENKIGLGGLSFTRSKRKSPPDSIFSDRLYRGAPRRA